jgi:hypothetical protein
MVNYKKHMLACPILGAVHAAQLLNPGTIVRTVLSNALKPNVRTQKVTENNVCDSLHTNAVGCKRGLLRRAMVHHRCRG